MIKENKKWRKQAPSEVSCGGMHNYSLGNSLVLHLNLISLYLIYKSISCTMSKDVVSTSKYVAKIQKDCFMYSIEYTDFFKKELFL